LLPNVAVQFSGISSFGFIFLSSAAGWPVPCGSILRESGT
jgi:hypothetical protein